MSVIKIILKTNQLHNLTKQNILAICYLPFMVCY